MIKEEGSSSGLMVPPDTSGYITSLALCCNKAENFAELPVEEMKKTQGDQTEETAIVEGICLSCAAFRCFFEPKCSGCNITASRLAKGLSIVDCCSASNCKGQESCSFETQLTVTKEDVVWSEELHTVCMSCSLQEGQLTRTRTKR